jgi:hypothetical protein
MNMVEVTGRLVNITQIIRNCPATTLRWSYVRALRRWCHETQWLRVDIDGETEANVAEYPLGNDPQLEIIKIQKVEAAQDLGTGALNKWEIVPANSLKWNPNIAPGMPLQYDYQPEASFLLWPTPSKVYGLTVTAIVQPKEGAVNIPEAPLLKYSQGIEAGALSYLFKIPGQKWTDKEEATMQERIFTSCISNGKAEVQRAYNTGSQRASPRLFIMGRRGSSLGWW